MEDYFAEAVDRLQAGETIEQILADYPDKVAQELHPLLLVVELAEQTAAQAPPQRLPLNRLAARVAFAQRAAELRAEMEAERARAISAQQREATTAPVSIFARLEARRRQIIRAWPMAAPVMRLAPLTLLLVVVYLLTSVVVAVAQEALPGEPAYPVKLWILEQQVATAPEEQRAEARWMADRQQSEDVARLASRLQANPNAAPVTAIMIQQFRGFDGEQLLIGDLRVIPWHQPPGSDAWLPLAIDGVLEPGAVVMLRYQVIPGAPNVVQGIALRVMQAPPVPTPEPTPTPTPAASLACQRIQPPHWVEYIVRPGDTLSHIAARAQTSVSELRRVNCLTDGVLRAGTTILVPIRMLGEAPTAPPPAVITALPTQLFTPAPATQTPAPIETPTNTPTIEPTAAQPGGENETAAPTPTAALEETEAPDVTDSPTDTPVPTETSPTPAEPTETGAPPQTAPPANTPTATLPATETAAATATATALATETPEPPVEVTAAALTETAPPATAASEPTATVGAPGPTPTLAPTPTTAPPPPPTEEASPPAEPPMEDGE